MSTENFERSNSCCSQEETKKTDVLLVLSPPECQSDVRQEIFAGFPPAFGVTHSGSLVSEMKAFFWKFAYILQEVFVACHDSSYEDLHREAPVSLWVLVRESGLLRKTDSKANHLK